MMRRLIALFAFAAITALFATPAAAWDELGRRNVADRTDRDSIAVPGETTFTRIRICVERRPVRFYDVAVVFANGARQEVPVRALIPPGGCTRAVALDGGPRDIGEILFVYEAATRRIARTSEISVWGE